MPTVARWTGREVRCLRAALRLTLIDFGRLVGVSDRMVSKWEAAEDGIQPRLSNQRALDTILATATAEQKDRFAALLTARAALIPDPRTEALLSPNDSDRRLHPVDGKLMARVEEGLFLSGPNDTRLWLPEFWIDVFPTTNQDYARFVAATGHPAPRHWPNERCPAVHADHPVVWVNWRDATAYATWAGKHLPTAEQWEKAARGQLGDPFPWGRARTAAKCNVRESAIGTTTQVTRYQSGASPYGVYDLCGNTWEWLASKTAPGRYGLKGSAFTSPFYRCEPSASNDASAAMCDDDTSFRCVVATLDT